MPIKTLIAVEVQFANTIYLKRYIYVQPPTSGPAPRVGDYIITSTHWPRVTGDYRDSNMSAAETLNANAGIAQVLRVFEVAADGCPHRFYAGVISLQELAHNYAAARNFAKRDTRRTELVKKLDALLVSPEIKQMRYEAMAEIHPEARRLLAELKAIDD